MISVKVIDPIDIDRSLFAKGVVRCDPDLIELTMDAVAYVDARAGVSH